MGWRSSDTCQTDMYTFQCFYIQNIVDLSLIVIEETDLIMKMWHKSLDRENEVKVMWHLPDWHVYLLMFVHTKYSWPIPYSNWETDLFMKMWRKTLDHENEVKVKWHLPDWHVHLSMYLHTKYNSHIPYSYWEMNLITKIWRKFIKVTEPWK